MIEPSEIIDVMIEIYVDPGGGIIYQKPTCLRDREAVGILVDKNQSDTERRLKKALGRVKRDTRLVGDLSGSHTLPAVTEHIHDAESEHDPRSLEDHRPERYELSEALCLAGVH